MIVHSCLEKPRMQMSERIAAVRMAVTTALLFAAASIVGRLWVAPQWYLWLGGVAGTMLFVSVFTLFVGPTPTDRRAIIARIRAMVTGLRRREA